MGSVTTSVRRQRDTELGDLGLVDPLRDDVMAAGVRDRLAPA
jgi:hypothetical protein